MTDLRLQPDDILDRAHIVALPMRVTFRGINTRELMLFDGPAGWAEWSPFPEYEPAEAKRWLDCALEMGFHGAPAPLRDRVAVNATVPAVDVKADPDTVPRLLERYPGCRTVKVKVAERGQSLLHDVARVRHVRHWFESQGIDVALRVDANGGWSVDEALIAITALADTGPIDYVEQPCQTIDELAAVRAGLQERGLGFDSSTPVRIAADELIRKASDPVAVVRAGACDVAVVKAAPLGGPSSVVNVANHIAEYSVPVTVSSALESAVGMGAGIAAAAAIPATDGEPHAAGLATGSLFVHDVTEPRRIVDGHLDVAPVVPDPARLAEFAVESSRRDWWFNRLQLAWNA